MRSRPDIHTFIAPRLLSPGERMLVTFDLISHSHTPLNGIIATLVGKESRYKNTVSTGRSSHRTYHRRTVVALEAKIPCDKLGIETRRFEVSFDLPDDAPPSYRSGLSSIAYTLELRVDIPWWPDAVETYAIIVVPKPTSRRGAPAVFTTEASELRGKEPIVELSLSSDRLVPGQPFDARVAVSHFGDRRIERVELSLAAFESARVKSSAGPTEVERHTWTVRPSAPLDGEATALRAAVPATVVPSFQTPFIEVRHVLEARAVVAWGRDLVLTVPVRVERGEPDDHGSLPLVGRARHREVWATADEVLRALGVREIVLDPDRGQARFSVGPVTVHAREEHHPRYGACVVAELRYPSLALELRVVERRWTELAKSPRALSASFRKRFSVAVREEAQLVDALDEDTQNALLIFDEVGLSDDCAVILRKGGVYQASGLQRALSLAQLLAKKLANAPERVGPPAALAQHLSRWQRFAEQQHARLRIADLSLHDWSVRGHSLAVLHAFEGSTPKYTTLRASSPRRGTDEADSAALSKHSGLTVVAHEGVIAARLPLCVDPSMLIDPADRIATALTALLTGNAGAYR
jgi:hypothetical protein